MQVIRIKSKRAGFRRCGIAHSDEWTEYPKASFNEQEIKRLKDEPMLWVEEVVKKEPVIVEKKEPEEDQADKSKAKK